MSAPFAHGFTFAQMAAAPLQLVSENDKSRAELGASKRIKQKSASLYQSAPGKPEAKKGPHFLHIYAYMRFFLILSPQCQCHQTLEIKKAFLEYREKGDFTILLGPSGELGTPKYHEKEFRVFFASLLWLNYHSYTIFQLCKKIPLRIDLGINLNSIQLFQNEWEIQH